MKLLKDKFFWLFIGALLFVGVIANNGGYTPNVTSSIDSRTIFERNCLSGWDGSFNGIKDAMKERLKDPASFEHVKTTYTNEKGGSHIVMMKYRAKNGFGALDVDQIEFISDDNCNVSKMK